MWRKLPPVFFFYFHALTVAAMTAGRCGNAVDPVYQNKKFPIILRVWESIVWTKLKEEKICCVSVSLCSRTWQFLFFFLIDFFVCWWCRITRMLVSCCGQCRRSREANRPEPTSQFPANTTRWALRWPPPPTTPTAAPCLLLIDRRELVSRSRNGEGPPALSTRNGREGWRTVGWRAESKGRNHRRRRRPVLLLGDEPAATLTRTPKFDLVAQLQHGILQGHVDAFDGIVFVLGHL